MNLLRMAFANLAHQDHKRSSESASQEGGKAEILHTRPFGISVAPADQGQLLLAERSLIHFHFKVCVTEGRGRRSVQVGKVANISRFATLPDCIKFSNAFYLSILKFES
jgi:hypothetical protein